MFVQNTFFAVAYFFLKYIFFKLKNIQQEEVFWSLSVALIKERRKTSQTPPLTHSAFIQNIMYLGETIFRFPSLLSLFVVSVQQFYVN